MASVCIKISCALVVVLMLLSQTDGAKDQGLRVQGLRVQGLRVQGLRVQGLRVQGLRVRRNLHKHNTTDRQENLVLNTEDLAPAAVFRGLQNSSISPWTYDETHDPSLFPSHTVFEARCLLRSCLTVRGTEDSNLSSQLIKHQVLQLRRVLSNGTYHFRLEHRLQAVGCTCVRNTYVTQE